MAKGVESFIKGSPTPRTPTPRASAKAMLAAVKTWDAAAVADLARRKPSLVGQSDKRGKTPLHVACGVTLAMPARSDPHGIQTVDSLLLAGADLEAIERIPDDGEIFPATPLWYAVARGINRRLVDHLLDLGAKPDHCLWAVVWRDDADMCRALMERASTLDLKAAGETPLFYAARLQRLKTLELLLAAGADRHISGPAGETVAGIARKRGLPTDIVRRLE